MWALQRIYISFVTIKITHTFKTNHYTMKQYMYKLMLSLFCLVSFFHGNTQNISIGARGGILLANMEITPREPEDPDYKNVIVPQGALFVEIGIGNMFAIQPEIMYGTHGTKFKDSRTTNELGYTTTFSSGC